jgi:diguanylate cyclase (GGDEF)-like protein
LLDINMPGMDGYEVCRRLKASPATQNIPVIFISANTQEEDERLGLELGAVDYLTKPFRLPIVRARVRTHVALKQKTDALEKLSSLDGLTGIANRLRFDEHLDYEWRQGLRMLKPLSLIMVDIDFFKNYNDNYGHGSGDECLRKVAATLASFAQRPRDMVARYGGEEFVALLPETPFTDAQLLAERMRMGIELMNIPHAFSPVADRVTISMGLATASPTHRFRSKFLLEAADQALYQAKKETRNALRSINL